jgi:hypothetical protein
MKANGKINDKKFFFFDINSNLREYIIKFKNDIKRR